MKAVARVKAASTVARAVRVKTARNPKLEEIKDNG